MKEKKEKRPVFRIFSKDDRRKIVSLIEQGQLTRQEAMEQYGIIDPDTLRSWILRYSINPELILGKIFTKAEKRQAAYRVITGEISTSQLATEISVAPSSIRKWVRNVRAEIGLSKSSKDMSASLPDKITSPESIDDLRLKIAALETMIDMAERELNIDIRKKSGTKQ